jgi:sirohydrochlorin ferrochelatase
VTHVILLTHGSPDPRAAAAAASFAHAVEARDSSVHVHVAALDHGRDLAQVCVDLAGLGVRRATVVPAFVTSAHHVRVDVPAAVDAATERASLALLTTPALGTSAAVLSALDALLPDGPVVAAVAGTSDRQAQSELDDLAREWSERRGTPVVVGHAAQGRPTVVDAIAAVEEATGTAAAVAALVLFPGHLPDRITAAADGRVVTPPLSDLPETVDLVLERLRDGASRAA